MVLTLTFDLCTLTFDFIISGLSKLAVKFFYPNNNKKALASCAWLT
jgi:hypothetical protein